MTHERSVLVWIHGFCGTKNYVILPWKRFKIQRFKIRSLRRRTVYLALMLDITTLYLKMFKNWKSSKESRHFSLSRTTICPSGRVFFVKTCFRRTEKFEATVKEVANLNWEYYKTNLVCWKEEATNGENTHSKCCTSSSGTPASGALCSSTQGPGINWTNNDFPNPVGKTTKTSLLWIKFAIPSLCSAL